MRTAFLLLCGLVLPWSAAWAKLDGLQWNDAEKRSKTLFASPGEADAKASLVKLLAQDGEARAFKLLAEAVVAEALHCVKISGPLEKNKADLLALVALRRRDMVQADDDRMRILQGAVEADTQTLMGEQRVLTQIVAVAGAGSEEFRKIVLARCKGHPEWPVRAAGARVAAAMPEEPGSRAYLTEALDKDRDPRVRIAALQAFETSPGTSWHGFAIARLEDPEWGVQAAAANLVGRREGVGGKAIPGLITLLAKPNPRVAEEAVASLRSITGQNFDPYPEVWVKWWEEHRADYGDDGKPLKPLQSGPRQDDAAFYGIKIRSDRVLFVIDTSGSMKEEIKAAGKPAVTGDGQPRFTGPKIEVAKQQLKRAIDKLPKTATFNVIAFNYNVTQWQKTMMPATAENKAAANAWFKDLPPESCTFIDGALMAAFKMAGMGAYDKAYPQVAVDTILLLSDGAPTDNAENATEMDPEIILGHVREWNSQKRVIIHCVGIDNVVTGIAFLKKLAQENGGTYVDG